MRECSLHVLPSCLLLQSPLLTCGNDSFLATSAVSRLSCWTGGWRLVLDCSLHDTLPLSLEPNNERLQCATARHLSARSTEVTSSLFTSPIRHFAESIENALSCVLLDIDYTIYTRVMCQWTMSRNNHMCVSIRCYQQITIWFSLAWQHCPFS